MKIKDAYIEFTLRLNKLGTNANKNVEYLQFVSLINKAQLHWAEARIKIAEESLVRVDELQQLLKDYDEALTVRKENFYYLPLPADYFHRSRSYAKVQGCDGVVYLKFVEEGNINTLLKDSDTRPSAEWEETLATLFGGKIRVYFEGFELTNLFFKYYRQPKAVDIAGYVRSDGTQSTDIDLEFDGVNAQEIIDLAVQIASGDIVDQGRLASITRHIQENN